MKQGGVTSAKGFMAWGAHVGLKKKRKDLAMVVSQQPAHLAATMTTNLAKAAPIQWNQQILETGNDVYAILVNSGQANACTGAQGLLNAGAMAQKAAECLGCLPGEVVLASTGIIGPQIPMPAAISGIAHVVRGLRSDEFAGSVAAESILTTDSCVKQCATTIIVEGVEITLGAMAKGSGMIHPNMATMLSFITTDAAISPELLKTALKASVDKTYNMISVDGDTSTNDMVAILANGAAGNVEINDSTSQAYADFCQALDKINCFLAKKIAADAEGASKRITVTVQNAASQDDAQRLAKAVVSSNLVKASLFDADPNWGRVVVALGYAGAHFDLNNLLLSFISEKGMITAVENGEQHADYNIAEAKDILQAAEVEILINVAGGDAYATAWGCDMRNDSIRKTSYAAMEATADATDKSNLQQLLFAEVG